MRKALLTSLSVLFLAIPQAVSQDKSPLRTTLIVLPFETGLFLTDMMRDMASQGDMEPRQVTAYLREALRNSLNAAFRDTVGLPFGESDADSAAIAHAELQLRSVARAHYLPLFPQSEDGSSPRGAVERGQIVTSTDTLTRHMAISPSDKARFRTLADSLGTNLLVYAAQMEVHYIWENSGTAPFPTREAVIHYTALRADGSLLCKGIERHPLTEGRLSPQAIAADAFHGIAMRIRKAVVEAAFGRNQEGKGKKR